MSQKKRPSQKKVAGRRHVKKDQGQRVSTVRRENAPSRQQRQLSPLTRKVRGSKHGGTTKTSRGESTKESSRLRIRPAPRPLHLTPGTRADIRSALRLVRQHIRGYESFTLKRIESGEISSARVSTLKKRARELRTLLAQPHDLIKVPRKKGSDNKKVRHELYKFTHQKIRNAKHFIVHKPADHFRVSLSDGGHVVMVIRGTYAGKVSGESHRAVITESQFFLFERTARDADDALHMLRRMLPDMPEGFYVVLTGMHGDTGEPVSKGQLITRLRTYMETYQTDSVAVYDREGKFVGRREADTGFVQAVTGFRYLHTSIEGVELQMQARDTRRERQREFNERLKKERLTASERQAARDEIRRQGVRVPRKRRWSKK